MLSCHTALSGNRRAISKYNSALLRFDIRSKYQIQNAAVEFWVLILGSDLESDVEFYRMSSEEPAADIKGTLMEALLWCRYLSVCLDIADII